MRTWLVSSTWLVAAYCCFLIGLSGCPASSARKNANPAESHRTESHRTESQRAESHRTESQRTESHRALGLSFADREIVGVEACNFNNGRESGLNSILEIIGGGVACFDYDADGSPDLIFARGGQIDTANRRINGIACTLFKSQTSWRFVDATDKARMDTSDLYTQGLASADFDHDGFGDVLVYGYGGASLLVNRGDGTFSPLSLSAFIDSKWTTAATWIDINGDKSLDLYLGSYVDWNFDTHQVCPTTAGQPDVCAPTAFKGTTNTVLVNNCDGTFVASASLPNPDHAAKTLGLLAADFGNGQNVGLYVANDLVPNFFYSHSGGRWQEHGFSSGVAVDDQGISNGSMGVALLDFNLDRKFDIFVTNLEHEQMALYSNVDGFLFQHCSRQAGLNRPELAVVGFGTVAGDFDEDGDEDIVFTSGRVHYHPDNGPIEQLPKCLENIQGKRFETVIPDCPYFSLPAVGRGLATCDFDGDGDLDLVATKLFGPPSIIENTSKPDAHWLCVTLVGVRDARTPIGTTVELTAGSHSLVRQLYGGGSYLSQSQQTLSYSWPRAFPEDGHAALRIRWPSGQIQEIAAVSPNRHILVVQQDSDL
jgi:hypothetical protein